MAIGSAVYPDLVPLGSTVSLPLSHGKYKHLVHNSNDNNQGQSIDIVSIDIDFTAKLGLIMAH